MLNDRSSARARATLLATSALALGALGSMASAGFNVVGPTTGRTADVASAHSPNAPGNPMLANQAVAPADQRRQWLRARRSRGARALRKATGTHKQNRRRALAGKGAR